MMLQFNMKLHIAFDKSRDYFFQFKDACFDKQDFISRICFYLDVYI